MRSRRRHLNRRPVTPCLIAVVLVVGAAERQRARAAHPEARSTSQSRSFEWVARVSPAFRGRLISAAKSIPDNVWQGLKRRGWRFMAAPFVTDAAPSLLKQQPRGWPAGATWRNTDGVHLPTRRWLVFAQQRQDYQGRVVAASRVGGVVRHETGHAFDMATATSARFHSLEAEFTAAYARDVQRLSEEQRQDFQYFLRDSKAGRQEAFAEAFAVHLGGGSDTARSEQFRQSFPRVMKHVRRLIAEFDRSAEQVSVSGAL